MREFLFTTWEGGGNVAPVAGAVRRLRARRHRVRALADNATRADLEAAGADVLPWRSAPNRPDRRPETCPLREWEATEPGGGLLRVLDRLMIGPAEAYAADTLGELRREPAGVLVSSEMLFGPMIAAEASGVPLALLGANISLFPIEGMPPIGLGLAPPRTEEERAVAAQAAGWMAAQLEARLPALNTARAAFGLPPLDRVLQQPAAARLTLLATSSAFDFPVPALPPRLRYVGPLLDEPEWAGWWQSPWPAGDPRPLVLVALSTTFQDQASVIQRVLDACAPLPVRVVATLGPALAGEVLRVPENAVVLDRASHQAIMREAALVVTHCGHGTVMRALAHGLPILCLPMGRDQNDNAVRVTERGAGLRLAPDANAGDVRTVISRLLAEAGFANAAQALRRAIACADEPNALVEALEGLAAWGSCRAAARVTGAGAHRHRASAADQHARWQGSPL
jgi:MGT family glycosyltransferase